VNATEQQNPKNKINYQVREKNREGKKEEKLEEGEAGGPAF